MRSIMQCKVGVFCYWRKGDQNCFLACKKLRAVERNRKLKVSVEKWNLIDVAHISRYARYAQLDAGDATDMSENSWISFKGDFAQIEKSTLTVCGTEDTKPF